MKPVPIVPGIEWVGVLDPQLRIFDVIMQAEQGTTYNSYLVRGQDKIALIDANKGKFADTFLDTLRQTVDPAKIDYIILNHMEPDHSSALPELLEACPDAKVVLTRPGKSFAENIVNRQLDTLVVQEETQIDRRPGDHVTHKPHESKQDSYLAKNKEPKRNSGRGFFQGPSLHPGKKIRPRRKHLRITQHDSREGSPFIVVILMYTRFCRQPVKQQCAGTNEVSPEHVRSHSCEPPSWPQRWRGRYPLTTSGLACDCRKARCSRRGWTWPPVG